MFFLSLFFSFFLGIVYADRESCKLRRDNVFSRLNANPDTSSSSSVNDYEKKMISSLSTAKDMMIDDLNPNPNPSIINIHHIHNGLKQKSSLSSIFARLGEKTKEEGEKETKSSTSSSATKEIKPILKKTAKNVSILLAL